MLFLFNVILKTYVLYLFKLGIWPIRMVYIIFFFLIQTENQIIYFLRIGSQLKLILSTKKEINIIIIQTIPALLTEFASNSSIASIFLPIIDGLVNSIYIYIYILLILYNLIFKGKTTQHTSFRAYVANDIVS